MSTQKYHTQEVPRIKVSRREIFNLYSAVVNEKKNDEEKKKTGQYMCVYWQLSFCVVLYRGWRLCGTSIGTVRIAKIKQLR